MAYLCFLRKDEEGKAHEERRIDLAEDEDKEIKLGRDADKVDIHVDDPKASTEHALIRFDGINFWIFDLESRNGLRVDHKWVENSPLLDGYVFRIGRTYLRFHSDDPRHKQSS